MQQWVSCSRHETRSGSTWESGLGLSLTGSQWPRLWEHWWCHSPGRTAALPIQQSHQGAFIKGLTPCCSSCVCHQHPLYLGSQIPLTELPERSRGMDSPLGFCAAGCIPLPGDFEEVEGRSSSGWIRRAGCRITVIYSLLELSQGERAGA